jgi:hypothetical protein
MEFNVSTSSVDVDIHIDDMDQIKVTSNDVGKLSRYVVIQIGTSDLTLFVDPDHLEYVADKLKEAAAYLSQPFPIKGA